MSKEVKKRVWVIRTLNGNPFDDTQRAERAVRFAKYLDQQGYDVTFFGTAYIHAEKRYIAQDTVRKKIANNEKVVLFHVPIVYKKNISIKRLIYGREIAHALKKEIRNTERYPKPDIIFISYPTDNDCRVATWYGKKYNVPVIMDARDPWPDVFIEGLPKGLRTVGKITINLLKHRVARTFKKADAICAMSPVMLRWALNYAGRERSKCDRSIFIAYDKVKVDESIYEDYLRELAKEDITEKTWNICYFATLSRVNADINTVIKAIELVGQKYPQIRLIIGGRGDEEEYIRSCIKDSPYIKMLGWLNQNQMTTIMNICKISLLYTINNATIKNAWGNRVGQYLSYGLPYVTCVDGVAKDYGIANSCGVFYQEGDARDLAEKIIGIIENPNELVIMSQNALTCYEKDFSSEVVMKQFETMICSVIEEKGALK